MVYKVVVVEDESIILKNIVKKIENADHDFKVVGTAFNGIGALEVIDKCKPDLLFTDIKIPIMDGLELVQNVVNKYPGMHIIIFSGYNEFEYARQALKLGVKDYLLKPVKVDILIETLKNVKIKIENSLDACEKGILASNINGLPGYHNTQLKNLVNSQYMIYLINIGHLHNPLGSVDNPSLEKVLIDLKWDSMLFEILKNDFRYWLFDENIFNQKLLVVLNYMDSNGNILPNANKLKDIISYHINPYPITICTHDHPVSFTDMRNLVHELKTTMEQGLTLGKSEVIVHGNEEIQKLPAAFIDSNIQNTIITLIQSGKRVLLKRKLSELLNQWLIQGYPQRWIEKAINYLIRISLIRNREMYEAYLEEIEDTFYEIISASTDLKSIQNEIVDRMDSLIFSNSGQNDPNKDLADGIEYYLRTNLSKPVTLEDLARKSNFDQSYLTKVFKRYKGVSPIKYLILLRMEEAIHLLKTTPEISIREVAEIVGYPDQHYFSRVFKEITGKSPSEYRNG